MPDAAARGAGLRVDVIARDPHAAPAVLIVRVKPRSRTALLAQRPDGSWIAQVKAAAIEGRANEELVALVARHFHCPKRAVSIKSGAARRVKMLRIAGGVG